MEAEELGRICSYDHSNPFLLEDFKAGVGMMLALKPHFLHFQKTATQIAKVTAR